MKKTINGRKLDQKKYEGEGSGGVYSSKQSGSHLGLSQGQDKSGKSEYSVEQVKRATYTSSI